MIDVFKKFVVKIPKEILEEMLRIQKEILEIFFENKKHLKIESNPWRNYFCRNFES